MIWPTEAELEERFRRTFLHALERAQRLRPDTRARLLQWRRSGFSARTTQRIAGNERERLERLARYATRVVVACGKVRLKERGRVEVETPPDPTSGRTIVELDEIDFVHAICQQVPDRGMHLVRYYGAYANRRRRALREARAWLAGDVCGGGQATEAQEPDIGSGDALLPARPGSALAVRRQAWARMIKKVFEVDPLVCPRCRSGMVVVAYVHEPAVIDRILRHRRACGIVSPFEDHPARAPPAA